MDNLRQEDADFKKLCPANTECNEMSSSICARISDIQMNQNYDEIDGVVDAVINRLDGEYEKKLRNSDKVAIAESNNLKKSRIEKLISNGEKTSKRRNSGFTCTRSGKFANPGNSQEYWFCGPKPDGTGYSSQLRMCPKGLRFDPLQEDCIAAKDDGKSNQDRNRRTQYDYVVVVNLEDHRDNLSNAQNENDNCVSTTTTCRTLPLETSTTCAPDSDSFHDNTIEDNDTANETMSFACEKSGVFPDPVNCTSFYICHPRKLDPKPIAAAEPLHQDQFDELKVSCPDSTAFDREKGQCTKEESENCQKNLEKPQNIVFIQFKKKRRRRRDTGMEKKFIKRNE